MAEAMVTGRMSEAKKKKGASVLKREGLNASQAINLLYDRLIEDGQATFLTGAQIQDAERWRAAAEFVDSLSERRETKFDSLTDAEIRIERLKSRGLM